MSSFYACRRVDGCVFPNAEKPVGQASAFPVSRDYSRFLRQTVRNCCASKGVPVFPSGKPESKTGDNLSPLFRGNLRTDIPDLLKLGKVLPINLLT